MRALPLEGGGERVGVKGLTGIARGLRKKSTDAERRLWRHLRDRQIEGFKFRRQQPVGKYVVDFVNLERKINLKQGKLYLRENVLEKWLDKAREKGSLYKFPHKEVRSAYFSTKASAPLARGRRFFFAEDTTLLAARKF